MWMDEFVKKWYDFIAIYRIFVVKIVIGLSKNHCDLILNVGFDFSSNVIIGSSYIRWKLI